MANTNLARVDDAALAPATYFGEALDELELTIAANLGEGATLGLGDLDRIKFPGAGSLAWRIPGLDKPRTVDEFEGVILLKADRRGYYAHEYKGGNPAPDCHSRDMTFGSVPWNGTFGGKCATCPMGKFIKSPAGKWTPPKCKATATLFILTKEQALPVVLNVPSTSMPVIRDYFKALTKFNIAHFRVVTVFSLEEAISKGTGADDGGIPYAKLKIRTVRNEDGTLYRLSMAECVALAELKKKFAGLLLRASQDEIDGADGADEADDHAGNPVQRAAAKHKQRASVVEVDADSYPFDTDDDGHALNYQDGVSAEELL